MTAKNRIDEHLLGMKAAIDGIDSTVVSSIEELLYMQWEAGKRLFLAGNGGSHALASHAVIDFQKCIVPTFFQQGLKAICLGDSVTGITAWANDFHFEGAYAQMLKTLAEPGDLLMIFSVSGNSPNLIKLVDTAAGMGVGVISMVGRGGTGKVVPYSEISLSIDSEDYGIAEDCFSVVMHSLVEALKLRFLPK